MKNEYDLLYLIYTIDDDKIRLSLNEDWFLDNRSKVIFRELNKLNTNDINVACERLKINNDWKVKNILSSDVMEMDFESCKDILKQNYSKAKVLEDFEDIKKNGIDASELNSKLKEMSNHFDIVDDKETFLGSLLVEAVDNLKNKEDNVKLLKTNFTKLDENIDFSGSNTTIITANTGIGKTTFALNIFTNFIKNGNEGVFYSLEMTTQEVINKMLSSLTKIQQRKFSSAYKFNEFELNKIQKACIEIETNKVFIEDKFDMSIEDIKNDLRFKKKQNDIKFAFIDHVGLISATEFKGDRRLSVGHISRELKKISKELDIHIFIIVQLNRGAETEDAGLHHLSESADLERDASNVLILKRDRYGEDQRKATLKIAKVRVGSPVEIDYMFELEHSLINEEVHNEFY